ncbi:acetolactate synthase, small subunit [Candidatus Kryptobacter tengchongensis]|uniref:Acetolactate synthase small subunit n=1 Tax=Kryptobacter tengchongensis TaxID=1643429 RepID=A0A656D1Q0_KRYT1|nr:acetolactate synthase small subunit [Candidatus Kryptobacter tengchongensis]CUS96588.1 acetolactate synthase, small subunit [Candidatus Kryptobacter tengchongensis]CUT02983.1 acetolactate synthase, small subunit [Candidatus Kryptobacter tengchongensis]CUU00836.1 acetolactate synthase, small subunit [Candidatus Kryptobacter tengchongensis]CUU06878.1 acetolactate synthase, small subunit [Candidatus Kryptobacter tengchongensis]
MRHTISILVENKFGVLTRIAGLFSAKGYNIESISVGPTEDPTISRMTIVTNGDDDQIEQIIKQLNKLIDILKVVDLTNEPFVERELALIKVKVNHYTRSDVIEISDIFRAKVVDIGPTTLTIEVTGRSDKITAMINMLAPYGIVELARTGVVALKREFKGEVYDSKEIKIIKRKSKQTQKDTQQKG